MYADVQLAKRPLFLSDIPLLTKAGIRGFPGIDPAQELLIKVLKGGFDVTGPLIDLTAMGGIVGHVFSELKPTLIERSKAALNVLGDQFSDVRCHLASELTGSYATVLAVLPADRGNEAVEQTLDAAHRLTQPGGLCYLAGDKDKGFDRYFKWAQERFGTGDILERKKGLRVAGFRQERAAHAAAPEITYRIFEEMGLKVASLPGTFSAQRIDSASRRLLENLGALDLSFSGKRVLDIGSGCGVLGAYAAQRGAEVYCLEDDYGSVLSTRKTFEINGLHGHVLHSDVGSELGNIAFDLVLTNPPFHVGHRLILDVAEAFIELAGTALKPNGELFLVANAFLAYEDLVERWGTTTEIDRDRSFKVLRGQKRGHSL